ncbi:MAG: LysR family transcriptional regulator [Xanthobacteraceae bacterium]
MFDLDLLRLFIRVVELGTITAAAREKNISSSFASRQIAMLERIFEKRILIRTGRNVVLTDAGRACFAWARENLAAHEKLLDDIGAIDREPQGLVRFACYTPAIDSYMMEALQTFNERYPNIVIEVAISDRPVRFIQDGFDIAIHAGPMPKGSFVTKTVRRYQRLICAAPAFLENHPFPNDPHDIARLKCLTHVLNEGDIWRFAKSGESHVSLKVSPSLRSNSYLLLRDLAIRGMGVICIGENLVRRDLNEGRLVQLLPEYRCLPTEGNEYSIRLIYPSRELPHRVRLFEQHLSRHLKDHWTRLDALEID